jgi:hypothetical protein
MCFLSYVETKKFDLKNQILITRDWEGCGGRVGKGKLDLVSACQMH